MVVIKVTLHFDNSGLTNSGIMALLHRAEKVWSDRYRAGHTDKILLIIRAISTDIFFLIFKSKLCCLNWFLQYLQKNIKSK